MVRREGRRRLVFLLILTLAGCAARDPQTAATRSAQYGTVLVHAVGELQKQIIAGEASGAIPRNTAVTAMEAIGRGLQAAQHVSALLRQLSALPARAPEAATLEAQIRSALATVTEEVGGMTVPDASPPVQEVVQVRVDAVREAVASTEREVAQVRGGQ